MNTTITMKMTLLLFWLCSGFFHFTFASNRLRLFLLDPNTNKNMSDSLDDCKKNNASFVTVYDDEDAIFVEKIISSPDKESFWLGLHEHQNISLTWSNSEPLSFSYSSVNVKYGTQQCEAINNSTWRGFDCSDRKYFMCYEGNNYILIKKEKSWCQALQYCRKYFTDLVSISNETQNDQVIEKGNGTTFWIGLMHDNWEWVDKGCSSFRKFEIQGNPDICTNTAKNPKNQHILYKYRCEHFAYSFCSKGTVRIKVIKKKMTWEDAFDYCREHHTGLLWIKDENDHIALKQWLNYTTVKDPFWIGLRQSRVFGFWIWTNENNSAVTFQRWSNDVPELPLSNHCAVINATGLLWSDENCLVEHNFLCEEEILFMNQP